MNEKQPKKVATPSFYTCEIETGGKRTLGVKDGQRKEYGRNIAKLVNQFGSKKVK
jgi:hypothetical protein